MLLEEYARANPFSGAISFHVWDARHRCFVEGFSGSANLTDNVIVRHYDKKLRKAEIDENGRLNLEVFLGEEVSPEVPKIEIKEINPVMTETKECVLEETDELFEQIYEEFFDLDRYEVPVEDSEDECIEVEGIRVVIPEIGLSMRQGEFCVYDPDEDMFMADFSISLIYELNEKDPAKFLYWEQDGYEVSLYNFLRTQGKGMSMDKLSGLKCTIEIELASQEEE